MVGYFRSADRSQRATALGLAIVAVLGILACFASVTLSGTKTGAVLALMATLGPVALYVAIVSPVLFPFGVYAVATPFDTLLTLPAFGTMTKILGVVSAAALLFYILRTKRAIEPPRAAMLWLLFYLWVTATLWWAIDTESTLQLLQISWSLLALFFVTSMFRMNYATLRNIAGAVFVGGVLAGLYGLYFFHSGHNLAQTGGRLWIQSDTAQINPDHYANALILPMSLALVGALWVRRWSMRLVYIGSLLIMLLAMALSGSRGALLGFGAVIVFLLVKDRHRLKLAIVSSVGCVVGFAVAGSFLAARFSTALSSGGAGRTQIWRAGWAAFKQNWLWGAGYGNFPFAYDRVYLSVFQALDPHFHRASHNIVLNAAVETGIIGLGLMLAAWLQTFRLLSPIEEGDYRFPLRLAVQGAIIGLFVAGMFADLMITKYVWLAFMLAVMTYNAAPVRVPAQQQYAVTREVAASA